MTIQPPAWVQAFNQQPADAHIEDRRAGTVTIHTGHHPSGDGQWLTSDMYRRRRDCR